MAQGRNPGARERLHALRPTQEAQQVNQSFISPSLLHSLPIVHSFRQEKKRQTRTRINKNKKKKEKKKPRQTPRRLSSPSPPLLPSPKLHLVHFYRAAIYSHFHPSPFQPAAATPPLAFAPCASLPLAWPIPRT